MILTCPLCESDAHQTILDARPCIRFGKQVARRRHKCAACAGRWTSITVQKEEVDRLQEEVRRARMLEAGLTSNRMRKCLHCGELGLFTIRGRRINGQGTLATQYRCPHCFKHETFTEVTSLEYATLRTVLSAVENARTQSPEGTNGTLA